jgi:N-dimethylarginine dimethylaminohydrolase
MKDTILMCEPKYFAVSYEINPWMAGNIGLVDHNLAFKQWNNLADTISKYATIQLIEPVNGLPDMVFTANAAFTFNCRRNKYAIISRFRNEQRSDEEEYFADWFADNQFFLSIPNDPLTFEGAGDCLMSNDDYAWMGFGFRSSSEAKNYVSQLLYKFGIITNPLHLIDDRFYHLDTCFCPIGDDHVIYFPGAFDEESNRSITNHFNGYAIAVDEEDATNFACNAVNIGDKVILNKASHKLKDTLHFAGFEVIETDLSEFMKSGGAAKCLTLKI